jgi:hypothetical protein
VGRLVRGDSGLAIRFTPGAERGRDTRTGSFVAPGLGTYINLTGDYIWHSNKRVTQGRFRPLLTRTHTRKFLVYRGRSKAIFDTAKR